MLLVCAIVVYINLHKFEDVFWQPEAVALQDDFFEQDEVFDPIAENVTEMLQQLDASMVHGYLEKLVSYGPHPTRGRIPAKLYDLPIEKARKYLYNELQSMGLEVRYQYWEQKPTLHNLIMVPKWRIGWFLGNNIVATLPGTDKSSDEIYVISAHYDTVPDAPGANDDSSGVAAILAIAEIMSQYSFDHTIRFVLTDGEELGLLGAYAYVEDAHKNNENIVATICIEMLGFAETEEGSNNVKVLEKEASSWISQTIVDVSDKYSDHINLEVFPNRDIKFGDFLSFLNYGYDSVTIYGYDEDSMMHTPGDTIERLNMPYLAKGSRLVLATLAEWALND